LKIHHVINDIAIENGGAQMIARQLHTGLHQRGADSRLVTVVRGDAASIPYCSSFGFGSPYDLRAIAHVVRYLRRECSPEDIVHVHLFPAMLFVSLAVQLAGWSGKLVATEHNTSNSRRGSLLGRCIDTLLYSRYDQVVCISSGARDALAEWMPGIHSRLVVVENGARLTFTELQSRPLGNVPTIVSVGRLHKQKNYDNALKALALIQGQPFEYLIAGTGPEEASLKRLCAELGLSDSVRFLGFVEDVPRLLGRADIFLMPSRWEGFGLSGVEAMNAGLPIVAGNVEGLREIVSTCPPSGIVVNPLDPTSIAEAVSHLLSNPGDRLSYGEAGFRQSQRYSLDAMTEKYLDLYRRL